MQDHTRHRWLWPTVVVVLMLGAFGVGALIASRTELFPPQVDGGADVVVDPGASASPTGGPEGPAAAWTGRFDSRTSQAYREGVCRTSWAGALAFEVTTEGTLTGRGEAVLGGDPDCPFPLRQPQVRSYTFEIEGTVRGERVSMAWERFRAAGRGLVDHGGFGPTIADPGVQIDARAPGGSGSTTFTLDVPTAEGVASARSRTRVEFGCAQRC
ncbi:MAG: hypothetical protein WD206_08810 [Actinomycetota bacterium]